MGYTGLGWVRSWSEDELEVGLGWVRVGYRLGSRAGCLPPDLSIYTLLFAHDNEPKSQPPVTSRLFSRAHRRWPIRRLVFASEDRALRFAATDRSTVGYKVR